MLAKEFKDRRVPWNSLTDKRIHFFVKILKLWLTFFAPYAILKLSCVNGLTQSFTISMTLYSISEVIQLFQQSVSTVMRMSHIAAWLISALLCTSWEGCEKRVLKGKLGSSRGWNRHRWLSFRLMAVMSLGHSKEDIVPKHTRMSKQLLSVSESQMIHSQNLFNEPARFFFFSRQMCLRVFWAVTAVSRGTDVDFLQSSSSPSYSSHLCLCRIT